MKRLFFVLTFAAGSSLAPAAVISDTAFYGPGVGANVQDVASTPTVATLSNISHHGTLCFDPFCNPAPDTVVTSFNVSDPITVRLTNATFGCNNPSAPCSDTYFRYIAEFDAPAQQYADVVLHLAGTAPANFAGLSAGLFIQNSQSVILPYQAVPVDAQGNFNSLFHAGITRLSTTYNKVDIAIRISGLGAKQSISLPNSLTVSFNPVPEPATLGFTAAGLLGLAWVSRRRGGSRRS